MKITERKCFPKTSFWSIEVYNQQLRVAYAISCLQICHVFNNTRHGGIAAHFQVIIERGILSFMTGYTLIFTAIWFTSLVVQNRGRQQLYRYFWFLLWSMSMFSLAALDFCIHCFCWCLVVLEVSLSWHLNWLLLLHNF